MGGHAVSGRCRLRGLRVGSGSGVGAGVVLRLRWGRCGSNDGFGVGLVVNKWAVRITRSTCSCPVAAARSDSTGRLVGAAAGDDED